MSKRSAPSHHESEPLHRVEQGVSYQVWSVHTPPDMAAALERIGVSAGRPVEVLHNDHRGTVGLRAHEGCLVVLGRAATFHIRVRRSAVATS